MSNTKTNEPLPSPLEETSDAGWDEVEAELWPNQIKDMLDEIKVDFQEKLEDIKDEQNANTDLIVKTIWEATKLINIVITLGGILFIGYIIVKLFQ